MKRNAMLLAALLLGPGVAALGQTGTTVAAGVLYPTESAARVNGVRIQVQPDGSVWFLEATSDSIAVLKDGVIKRWQIRDSTHLGANPVDFEIDGDVVWFIETGQTGINAGECAFAKLDTATNQLTEWVIPGSMPAGFHRTPDGTAVWIPQSGAVLQYVNLETLEVVNYRSPKTYAYADMIVAPDGALWLADFGDNRIVQWVPGAATEKSWTFYPFTTTSRPNPSQIGFDDKGFLWIAQSSASAMDRFDPATGQLWSFTGISRPLHFELVQNRLYVTSAVSASTISVLDIDLAVPIGLQTLTKETLAVGCSPSGAPSTVCPGVIPNGRPARIRQPTGSITIPPTTFASVPAPISADKITVTSPGSTNGILTTVFPSAHTYGVTVAGGLVWVGTDGYMAALNLQATGADTDQSVPVATSQGGAANDKTRVDVTLSNLGSAAVSGDALYLFSPGVFAARAPFTLAPGATLALPDAFGNVATTTVNGPVRLRTTSGNAAGLDAKVRSTRVQPDTGTFGYLIPAVSAGGSLGPGSATTLFTGASSSQVSTLDLYTLNEATGTLTLAAPDGTTRGTRDFALVKNETLEFDPAASAFGVAAEPGDVIRVAVKSGSLQASVGVLDSGTHDVAPSLPIAATTDAVIPNAGSLIGIGGRSFVSDLYLSNPDPARTAILSLAYYGLGVKGPPQNATVSLNPGQSRAISNFLPTLFSISSGQGALLVTSSVPVAVSVRIAARYASGDYGTFAAAIDGAAGVTGGQSAVAIGLPQTVTRRSNLLLYNRGTAGTVTVTGFKSDGTEAGHRAIFLGDHQGGRLDSVFAAFGITDQAAGRIRLDVTQGMTVFAWTAEIDRITGDVDVGPPR